MSSILCYVIEQFFTKIYSIEHENRKRTCQIGKSQKSESRKMKPVLEVRSLVLGNVVKYNKYIMLNTLCLKLTMKILG